MSHSRKISLPDCSKMCFLGDPSLKNSFRPTLFCTRRRHESFGFPSPPPPPPPLCTGTRCHISVDKTTAVAATTLIFLFHAQTINFLNPLHPNISKYLLQTYPEMPTWRICQTIKALLVGDELLYSPDLNV